MGTLSGSMETMLASRWSWQGVWGFGFFYTVFAGMLYYFFLQSTPEPFSDQGNIPTPRELTGSDLTKVLRNRELWLISFLFGCFNFIFIAFITWAPTFLHQTRGSSLARASLLVSATSILSIGSCPTLSVIGAIAGWKAKIK
jgi:cyanate permease